MPDNEIIPIDQILPNKLPVITLIGRPIFPGIFTPIMIANPPDMQIVEQALTADGMVGLVLAKEEADTLSAENLFSVGTVAKIVKRINLPDGGINIFISTLKRFKIKKFLSKESPIVVAVSYLDDTNDDTDEIKALTRALLSEMKQISENNPLFSEEMRLNMINIDHPGKIADFIASILNVDKKEQQKVLETLDVHDRMERVLIYIKKEQELLRIQKKVQAEINEKIEKSQRSNFLKEELKAIKQSSVFHRTRRARLPIVQGQDRFIQIRGGSEGSSRQQELEKFNMMDPSSSEYIVTRNWLDLICSLPWVSPLSNDFDMAQAQKTLEADHYGLNERQGQNRRVSRVSGSSRKTRRARYSALLGLRRRQDERWAIPSPGRWARPSSVLALGGCAMRPRSKGTGEPMWVALPGKIIQGLKISKTRDPVFISTRSIRWAFPIRAILRAPCLGP